MDVLHQPHVLGRPWDALGLTPVGLGRFPLRFGADQHDLKVAYATLPEAQDFHERYLSARRTVLGVGQR